MSGGALTSLLAGDGDGDSKLSLPSCKGFWRLEDSAPWGGELEPEPGDWRRNIGG